MEIALFSLLSGLLFLGITPGSTVHAFARADGDFRFNLVRLNPGGSPIIYRRPSQEFDESILYSSPDETISVQSFLSKNSETNSSSIKSKLLASSTSFRFYVPLYIGTPSKKQLLLFTSLRNVSYVQEKKCNPCFKQPDALYSISASSTAKTIPCTSSRCTPRLCTSNSCAFNATVSGSNFRGLVVTDVFKFTDLATGTTIPVPSILFRAVRNSTNFSIGDVDGIASFGPGTSSLSKQFASVTGRYAFSICVSTLLTSDNSSKLVLGKQAIAPSGISYTPILRNSLYSGYHLQIRSIFVGGKKVGVPASIFTFDATNPRRATFLELSYEFVGLVQEAFVPVSFMIRTRAKAKRLARVKNVGSLSPCYLLNARNITTLNNYFPTITIRLANRASLSLAGYQYVYPVSENVVCSFIVNSGSVSILGALALQNVLTVYDVAGGKIGFKRTTCAKF